jgi:tetratricopeptide (TPR) repeat protein
MPPPLQPRFLSARLPVILSFTFLLFPCLVSAGIWLSSLVGTCLDEEGKPMADAVLRFTDPANGKRFEVTSNSEGRFTYIAVQPSKYRLDVIRARHQQATFPSVYLEWSSQPLLVEINLQKNSVKVIRQVLLAESFGSEQPAPAIAASEGPDAAVVRAINQKIAAAKAFMEAGDWDNALTEARAATALGPQRDLPWAWLADVYCEMAAHQPASADSSLQSCVKNYQYAIAIAPHATYYNNLGAAYSSMKQWKEATDNFHSAVTLTPDHAALYHQNLGAVLLKQAESVTGTDTLNTLQLAAAEFSLAVSSPPPLPEAYYWLGLCQLRLAASEAPGSSYKSAGESLRRYLQLLPDGPHAAEARAMIEGLQNLPIDHPNADPRP